MRKRKYRVWDKTAKQMIYLDDDNPHHSFIFIQGNAEYLNLQNGSGGDEYDIMDGTGVHDKHGVEIYEGDKVLLKDTYMDKITDDGRGPIEKINHICPIVFKHGAFGLEVPESGDVYNKGFCSFDTILIMRQVKQIEIIGNIHENPEF